jgi:hypothetical protein
MSNDSHLGLGKLERLRPLWVDLLFPFHTKSQAALLFSGALLAYAFVALVLPRDGALVAAFAGWVGGSLQLTTVAPARVRFPVSAKSDLFENLRRMHFISTDGEKRWTYNRPAWMKWPNSDVIVSLDKELVIQGPLSTLWYLKDRLLNHIGGTQR